MFEVFKTFVSFVRREGGGRNGRARGLVVWVVKGRGWRADVLYEVPVAEENIP
jgi:hypothetical protein